MLVRFTWEQNLFSDFRFNRKLLSVLAVFHKLFSSVAHPNLSQSHDRTPQNFASQKEGTKLYMAIHGYEYVTIYINPCPISVQAYENKT
jgi:hypothetical protein